MDQAATIMTTSRTNRWIPVIASISIQLCLGTAYIWSIFQSHLIIGPSTPGALFRWPATHGTLAYSLLIGVLAIGSTVGGRLAARYSMRAILVVAGIVLGGGFWLAQYTTEATPWVLWLTYGVLGGFGMGLAYTTTIACCQKWFPDRRGLVTGIIVSALGFGGLLFTPIAEALIASRGVLASFGVFGTVFVTVCFAGSFFVRNPPEGFQPEGWTPPAPRDGIIAQNFTAKEALRTPQFAILALAFMCATAAGSMMIPMAKILGLQPDSGLSKQAAVSGVMIITGFNSFGRLFWGWASDRLGRRRTILVLLVIAAASILGVSFAKSYLMLAFIALIGFSYGGFLGVFPALTADYWGARHVATIYGMLLIGFGIGAVASSYTVAWFSASHAYGTAFAIAGAAAMLGFGIMSLIRPPRRKPD